MYPEFHKDCPQCEAEKRQRAKEAKATPSITVGTQVRLTGVVVSEGPDCDGDYAFRIKGMPPDANTYLRAECLPFIEIIRQPFKRGEVVYDKNCARNDYPAIVINDEADGRVLLGGLGEGDRNQSYPADGFERRPSRPKEER